MVGGATVVDDNVVTESVHATTFVEADQHPLGIDVADSPRDRTLADQGLGQLEGDHGIPSPRGEVVSEVTECCWTVEVIGVGDGDGRVVAERGSSGEDCVHGAARLVLGGPSSPAAYTCLARTVVLRLEEEEEEEDATGAAARFLPLTVGRTTVGSSSSPRCSLDRPA